MIFYFSGSGNSYSVAKQIAENLNEEVYSLALFDDYESCQNAERIGIVFPCYMGQAPKIVLEFKEKLFHYISKDRAYIFCISTYANSTATSYIAFKNDIHAWFEVKMPENDIINSHAPKKEREIQLLGDARKKVDRIVLDIQNKKLVTIGDRPVMGLILKVVGPTMNNLYSDFNEHLYADESCTKCKQCQKYCPLKNITFDNAPVWGNNCANCMGCINRCPKQAIQFKKKTVGKSRYVHPDYIKVYY